MGRLLTEVSVSEMLATLEVFDQHGVSPEIFARIRKERNGFGKKVSDFMIGGGVANNITTHTSVDRAREIMGKNFLGIDAVVRRFRVSTTTEIAKALSVVSFTEKVLETAKYDHLLVADFGISLLGVRSKMSRNLFHSHNWYDTCHWAQGQKIPQWRLIRKTEVPNSFNKNWDEQQPLFQANEIVPRTRQMVYTIMLNYLENDERLFEDVKVRTLDVQPYDVRVCLGCFNGYGLNIDSLSNHESRVYIGIASEKKPNL